MKTKEAETVTLEFYCGNFILTTVTTWEVTWSEEKVTGWREEIELVQGVWRIRFHFAGKDKQLYSMWQPVQACEASQPIIPIDSTCL